MLRPAGRLGEACVDLVRRQHRAERVGGLGVEPVGQAEGCQQRRAVPRPTPGVKTRRNQAASSSRSTARPGFSASARVDDAIADLDTFGVSVQHQGVRQVLERAEHHQQAVALVGQLDVADLAGLGAVDEAGAAAQDGQHVADSTPSAMPLLMTTTEFWPASATASPYMETTVPSTWDSGARGT
jgi:hypothetical protein